MKSSYAIHNISQMYLPRKLWFFHEASGDTGFSWDTPWEEMLWDHLPPSPLRKKWTVEKSWAEIQWKVTEKTLSFSPILNYHHLHLWDCLQERSPVLWVTLSNSHRNSTNHSFYCAGHQKINKKKQKICICDSWILNISLLTLNLWQVIPGT